MEASGVIGRLLGVAGGDAQAALFPWKQVALCLCVVAAWSVVRALEWAWWRPRRLGRALRSQGLRGSIGRPSKTSFTWFGPVPRVTIAEPELVREVLSNKFGHFGRLQRMLHHGVSSHEGEKWAKHRRIINPAFHVEKLKRMLPAFAACCSDLVKRWEGLVADGKLPCEVDVWPEMQNLTGDVIARAAFGSSYLEGRRIFQLQAEQIHLVIATEVHGILKGVVAKEEDALRTGRATSDDLLGLLLESNMEHCRGGDGKAGITTDDVIGECKLFYFAGMETTSWQDRAREEVLRVFGSGGTPDYDGLSRLRIVTMVLYEVLRLYTTLPALQQQTNKPVELGGVRYPVGVMLVLPLLCIHHDRDVWGPDASEFRPERFAEGIAKASGDVDVPAFFPFGWGPRTCAKMGLAMILQRFKFELSPAYTHAPFPHGLLQPEHTAQVMLRRLP
ncbi:hypothetical protein SETIT_4G121400v2 [Setaria italica]|uniref:Cytochrome P450 n=1 Tax=Setaria italica TaxID=4555 RepID=K3Y3L1_SETIT|nr:hypothetical protein SETIT_4G121400v2 [Setaria italica]